MANDTNISITEGQLWAWMMDGNYPPSYPDMEQPGLGKLHRRATATLSRDISYLDRVPAQVAPQKTTTPAPRKGFRQPPNNKTRATKPQRRMQVLTSNFPTQGEETEIEITRTIKAGTRVNVVMASRMGDVGITTNLEVERGYDVRITCVPNMFMEHERLPQNLLIDIEPIEDPRCDMVTRAFPEGAKQPQDYTDADILGEEREDRIG